MYFKLLIGNDVVCILNGLGETRQCRQADNASKEKYTKQKIPKVDPEDIVPKDLQR